MPDAAGPPELERVASGAAREAGARVAAELGRAREVAGRSPPAEEVTRTRSGARRLLRELLAAATPRAASLQWVFDPLVGSHTLGSDRPRVAVSVAAAVDGEVVAGAVVDVLGTERFSAHLRGGARCDGQPIGVSGCSELAGAVLATGPAGCAALELCGLGSGRLDGYYDRGIGVSGYAAAALIAEEAGARVELPCPENDDLVLATVPGVFEELRALVDLGAP